MKYWLNTQNNFAIVEKKSTPRLNTTLVPSNKDPSSLFQIHGQRTMYMNSLKLFKTSFPVLTESANMAIVDK